jgi:four helix bundle protein
MFLQLARTKLHIFEASKAVVLECHKTKSFPADERAAAVSQIQRAALSTHLNVAEGCSQKRFRKENVSLKFPAVH